jgi:predicted nucleic acid-binding protein
VAEAGSDEVREAMADAERWFTSRLAFIEVFRAVGLTAGKRAAESFAGEWPSFDVVEVDQRLAEEAAAITLMHDLRSLDALHLASALIVPRDDLVLATGDRRLHRAAAAEALELLPETLPG